MHRPNSTRGAGRRRIAGFRFCALALAIAAAAGAEAQIATDGSVGARMTLSPSGSVITIPKELGRLSGGNLFHSFRQFNIAAGETADFIATKGVANVISRVTGADPSLIFGRLQLSADTGATPGFYLINPAGVVFGAGAVVDVPGAFHVGTADAVVFADGRFHADPQRASSFSSAAPVAFGFLGTQRAPVIVRDGAAIGPARGQTLTLAGGDVVVDGSFIGSSAGSLRVAAVGSDATDVPLAGLLPPGAGSITLRNEAALTAVNGADVTLGAGRVEISGGSSVYTTARADVAGGAIHVEARDELALSGFGNLYSDTWAGGTGGEIRVRAGTVSLTSGGYLFGTSLAGSTGRNGSIDLVSGVLRLDGQSSISTSHLGDGGGGAIRLRAGTATVDNAYVLAEGVGRAPTGAVTLEVDGALVLSRGGHVTSATSGVAAAAPVEVRAGSLRMDGGAYVASLSLPGATGNAGDVSVAVRGAATLADEASVFSSTTSSGSSGAVRVSATDLTLDRAKVSTRNEGAESNRAALGAVAIDVSGQLTIRNGSEVDTSTFTDGRAGNISLRGRDIVVEGGGVVSSQALSGNGSAGDIDLQASGQLTLRSLGQLTTSTFTAGQAGAIRVGAANILMDSRSVIDSAVWQTGRGQGGSIVLATPGALVMRQGASVAAITQGDGAAGNVQVTAGSVLLSDAAYITSSTAANSRGDAGRVVIASSGDLGLLTGGSITSDTYGAGRAGSIDIVARHVTLDSAGRISSIAGPAGTGDAGRIAIQAAGSFSLLNGTGEEGRAGQVSTSTFSSGNGGEIAITAANVLVDGIGAGVVSFAQPGSSGRAGSILLQAKEDVVIRRGGLSSSTAARGAAGSVEVEARRVLLDGSGAGIAATAFGESGGQTGSVRVSAAESIALRDGASVSIQNQATVAAPGSRLPTTLSLAAPTVSVSGGASVSADAFGNVAASAVAVSASESLSLDRGFVTTTANSGNGGPIRVTVGGLLVARNAYVGTSVFGVTGNGGDIDIRARTLLLDTGVIQANTAARNASGGLVRIAADALIASGNTLFLGGDSPFVFTPGVFGFNVIQAAAPTGVSGVVDLTSPVLDLTGSLRVLRADVVDTGGLGRSLCQATAGSSLALGGRGGLPASSRSWQRAESPSAPGLAVADGGGSLGALRVRGCL